MNLENCLRNELPRDRQWLREQLIGHLKEVRDRARKGEAMAVLHAFFSLYRFDDNQTDNDGFWGPDAREIAEQQVKTVSLTETLIGGVRDLQRHVRATIQEDATRIPPGLLAVIGAMHQAIQESNNPPHGA